MPSSIFLPDNFEKENTRNLLVIRLKPRIHFPPVMTITSSVPPARISLSLQTPLTSFKTVTILQLLKMNSQKRSKLEAPCVHSSHSHSQSMQRHLVTVVGNPHHLCMTVEHPCRVRQALRSRYRTAIVVQVHKSHLRIVAAAQDILTETAIARKNHSGKIKQFHLLCYHLKSLYNTSS